MIKISKIALFILLLRNIIAQPIIVQEDEPITYQSSVFYERIVAVTVLVLLGGVFAGKVFVFFILLLC